jgi:hypothetical protein
MSITLIAAGLLATAAIAALKAARAPKPVPVRIRVRDRR